jgi:[protein-PII] uridylyltransferase
MLAGRAEERLTFDYQREIAERMHYADRPGKVAVERFMRHLFPHAKTVGDLTGVFLAHLDEKFARAAAASACRAPRRRASSRASCSIAAGSRPDDDFSPRSGAADQMFALADRTARDPPAGDARRRRDAKLIDAGARRSARQRLVPRRADLAARSRDRCCAG